MRISDWSSDVCSSDLASKVAWNDEMRTLQPGESLVYQFQAKHAGMWMYHSGPAPALHHIGTGMFGGIIKIGRASCRERVCQYLYISVVVVSLTQKNSLYNISIIHPLLLIHNPT